MGYLQVCYHRHQILTIANMHAFRVLRLITVVSMVRFFVLGEYVCMTHFRSETSFRFFGPINQCSGGVRQLAHWEKLLGRQFDPASVPIWDLRPLSGWGYDVAVSDKPKF
jgi:hypothetical protein